MSSWHRRTGTPVKRDAPMPRLNAESKMDVLRKTARIIGESWKIDVVFRGEQAYTDGRTIIVPALPENAPDDLVEAIIGFVDHEVGHILHSDFVESFKLIEASKDPRLHPMTNAIEDIRQEYRMSEMYRGVGLNLERTMVWVMERVVKGWNAPGMNPFFKLSALMMMRAKARLGIPRAQEFYDELAGAHHPIIQRCEDELKTWYKLPDTIAAVHAAERILKILDDLNEPPAPQQQKPGQGQGEGGQGKGGKPEEKPKKEEKKPEEPKGEPKPEEAKPEQNKGKPEEAKGEEKGEASAAGDPKETGSAGQGEEEQKEEGAAGDNSGTETNAGEALSALSADVDMSSPQEMAPIESEQVKLLAQTTSQRYDNSTPGNLHDFGAAEIVKSASGAGGHRPYTTELDRIITPVGEGTLEQYSAISNPMKPITHVVSGVLTRTLLTQTKARTLRQRSSGAISLSNMAQVRAKQPNIFQTRRQGKDLDTYVELIIDHSGSMSGKKIRCAAQTAICLGDALDKVGISFGISGFTAGWGCTDGLTQEQLDLHDKLHQEVIDKGENYERTDPIVEYTYKTADEPYAKIKPRLALMERQWMGCNGDGDSIYQIAKRVAKRREKRKILIVLSDGLPAISQGYNVADGEADRYLKKVVPLIDAVPGMEILGIGIMTEAVRRYYRKSVVVNSIADLPKIAVTELKDALIGRTKPSDAA